MTDNTELKRAASEAKNWGGEVGEGRWYAAECFKRPYFSIPDAEFIAACEPGAVLALIAENDRLREDPGMRAIRSLRGDCADFMAERDQLKAENELQVAQFKKWQASHHANYCQVAEERDQLRAEVAGLRTGYEAYEQVSAELKAEVEGLRKALESCADELLAEIICKHGSQKLEDMHPVTRRLYEREMAPVIEARAALGQGELS